MGNIIRFRGFKNNLDVARFFEPTRPPPFAQANKMVLSGRGGMAFIGFFKETALLRGGGGRTGPAARRSTTRRTGRGRSSLLTADSAAFSRIVVGREHFDRDPDRLHVLIGSSSSCRRFVGQQSRAGSSWTRFFFFSAAFGLRISVTSPANWISALL